MQSEKPVMVESVVDVNADNIHTDNELARQNGDQPNPEYTGVLNLSLIHISEPTRPY